MGSKSKSSQESYNKNMGLINELYQPTAQASGQSSNALMALLGLGGDTEGQTAAFNNYKDSTGYQFQMDQGLNAVNGKFAGGGLFGSGARGKALMQYGQGLADSTFNNYLTQVSGVGQQGIQAGGLLSGVGQYNKGSSKTKGGLGEMAGGIGGLLSGAAAASDPRLKENIIKHGELEDGLGVYSWNYVWDDTSKRYEGVMADEVEALRPWALGPEVGGYKSVDYSKLNKET